MKKKLKRGEIACPRSLGRLLLTVILFQQHSPAAVVGAGRESREEQGPKVTSVLLAELIVTLVITVAALAVYS